MNRPRLPIEDVLGRIRRTLSTSSAVLAAPPGTGKTTIVPLALLQESWLNGKKILILEPRRLAARAAAARMAFLLNEEVGKTVGYQIRLERKISAETRIEVVTEGILTRKIQKDPGLSGIGLIIFDEFHERSIHADLALALCLDICQLREDLRLLVMSATLDSEPVAELLGNVPVIKATGISFPVEIEYLEKQSQRDEIAKTVQALHKVVWNKTGDILVFLPGVGEIHAVQKKFLHENEVENLVVLTLYGAMTQKKQDETIFPDRNGRRRIILSTSIAETSLSIEGITCVIDSGLSRRPRFDSGNGLTRLITQRVSKATARQRTGRAGRFGPGYCLRLWTRQEHFSLIPFDVPEILLVDLSSLVLELAMWGVAGPEDLLWLDSPRPGMYDKAKELLVSFRALTVDGRITNCGKGLSRFPLHPRLAHMIYRAREFNQGPLACDIAAILAERDILGSTRVKTADLETRLRLLSFYRKKGRAAVLREGGEPAACARIERAVKQWLRPDDYKNRSYTPADAGNLLAYAYPDRVARRHPDRFEHFQLINGRRANLPPGDLMAASEYIVIAHMDAGQREGRIHMAASLPFTELKNNHEELFTQEDQLLWDGKQKRVMSSRLIKLGQLIIEEKPSENVDPVLQKEAFVRGIKELGLECLPWTRAAREYQARVEFLRKQLPELELPDFSDGALISDFGWLEAYLDGFTSTNQLQKLNLIEILRTRLNWKQNQGLEKNAPERFTVPSGSKIRIVYPAAQTPYLPVKIQEMFGLMDTPRICSDRVGLVLHLLSPAQRPIQVTADLKGFWVRSYPEIKKELKGRYPKHFWPDDPVTAQATRGVLKKKR